jgi:thiosulfate dehydrogenase
MKKVLLAAMLVSGCSGEANVVHESAVERGERLFKADVGGLSCATCHAMDTNSLSDRFWPGAPLGGVTTRQSYWGGQEDDLLRAVNDCRAWFQSAPTPLLATDADAVDLYAFLESLSGSPEAVAFTVVTSVSDLPEGDDSRGREVFSSACATCHGELGSGKGRIDDDFPVLPNEALDEHHHFSKQDRRVVFVEKVRHGGFLGFGGRMPPFSLEALSDEQLSDLLSALALY